MRDLFKPLNLLFYMLSFIVFLFSGMILASVIGAAKDQGLAAGAIVLGYGVFSGFIALIAAIIVAKLTNRKVVVTLVKIFSILFLLLTAFFIFRYKNLKSQSDPDNQGQKTKPVTQAAIFSAGNPQYNPPLGLGVCSPKFMEFKTIYFYGQPNPEKAVDEHIPSDSLVFKNTETGPEIAYAPPWFYPIHQKIDYGILKIRMISLSRDFIEVLANEANGLRYFLDRSQCNLDFWPDFLIQINSVESLNINENPVRIKPLDHASEVQISYDFLRPTRASREWLGVQLLDKNLNVAGFGWIRWCENGNFTLKYSLLS